MIEKCAGVCGMVGSEFLDLNHTSKSMVLVSLMIPKFAWTLAYKRAFADQLAVFTGKPPTG
jgi:hypothetical protein